MPINDGSRYKTNCDFETAIPHYIDGVGRKYIPYWAPSLRDSAQYGIYFLPTSRQYNVVLPSQNRILVYNKTQYNTTVGSDFNVHFIVTFSLR